jgi:hypothetical protein
MFEARVVPHLDEEEEEGEQQQQQQQQQSQPMAPFSCFDLPMTDESSTVAGMYSLESASTGSTDTDSTILSVNEDQVVRQEQRQLQTVADLESPCGKLRHRTGDSHNNNNKNVNTHCHSNDDDIPLADDSDSEHGLVPRRRRINKATITSNTKRLFFYLLVMIVGVWSIMTIQSMNSHSRVDNDEWRHFQMQTLPMVRKALQRYEPEQEYTIVLRGKRLDLLQQSVDYISRCTSVKEVQIDYWEGGNETPMTLLTLDSPKVVSASQTKLATSAVFLLSEGIQISCSDLQKGM